MTSTGIRIISKTQERQLEWQRIFQQYDAYNAQCEEKGNKPNRRDFMRDNLGWTEVTSKESSFCKNYKKYDAGELFLPRTRQVVFPFAERMFVKEYNLIGNPTRVQEEKLVEMVKEKYPYSPDKKKLFQGSIQWVNDVKRRNALGKAQDTRLTLDIQIHHQHTDDEWDSYSAETMGTFPCSQDSEFLGHKGSVGADSPPIDIIFDSSQQICNPTDDSASLVLQFPGDELPPSTGFSCAPCTDNRPTSFLCDASPEIKQRMQSQFGGVGRIASQAGFPGLPSVVVPMLDRSAPYPFSNNATSCFAAEAVLSAEMPTLSSPEALETEAEQLECSPFGNLNRAIELRWSALTKRVKDCNVLDDGNVLIVCDRYKQIASLEFRLSKTADAIATYKQALRFRFKVKAKLHAACREAEDVANKCELKNGPSRADPLRVRVLDLRFRVKMHSLEDAKICSAMATIHLSRGEFVEAAKNVADVFLVTKQLEGNKSAYLADTHELMGKVFQAQNKSEIAQQHFESASQIRRDIASSSQVLAAVPAEDSVVEDRKCPPTLKGKKSSCNGNAPRGW